MVDYEDLILQRQELMEIWMDDTEAAAALGDWWDETPPEDFEEV